MPKTEKTVAPVEPTPEPKPALSAEAAEMAEIQRIALQRQAEQRKMAPESLVDSYHSCPRKKILKRLRDEGKIPDDMEPVFQLRDTLRTKAYEGFNPVLDEDRPGEYVMTPGGDVLTFIPKKTWDARKRAAADRSAKRVSEVDRTAEGLGIKNTTTVGSAKRSDLDLAEKE